MIISRRIDPVVRLILEFIHLIATESNDVCGKTTKKTISAEHVLQALQNLGFESYLDELRALSDEHRQEQKVCVFKSALLFQDISF